MNKLNYRFFYYKTRASYEKDSMYDRIPEDAIIFIEDEGSITTRGHVFGLPKTEIDFSLLSDADKETLALTITKVITSDTSKDGVYTKGLIDAMLDNITVDKDSIETIVKELLGIDGESQGDTTFIEQITEQVINNLTNSEDSTAIGNLASALIATPGFLTTIDGKIDVNLNDLKNAIGQQIAPVANYTAGEGINISSDNVISANVDDIAEKLTTSQEGETNQFIEQIIQNLFDTEHMSDEQIAELAAKLSSLVTDEEVGSVYTKGQVDDLIAGAGVDFSELSDDQKRAILTQLNVNNWTIEGDENDHALVFTK